jgi:radical SAM superfamily enzyme YgiQ (UPF0313 family)
LRLELITPESKPSRRLRRWRLIQFPQLTMPLLAGLTPEGVEIRHTDEIVQAVDLEREADLVAITCNTPAANHVYHLADEFRRRGRKVVLGGPHVTALPGEALPHADAVVTGEAECVWAGLIGDFRRGEMRRTYYGKSADLRGLPHARRDLIKGRAYGRGVIIATRGCPNGCGYCSIRSMYGPGQRQRPVEEVAREVSTMPGRTAIFWDDHLTADRRYALDLFRAIAPHNRWWTTQTTIQVAFDDVLLEAAAESGCKAFFIGLESISQDSLDSQGKGFNQVARFERAVSNLHRRGIAIQAGAMFGLDGDDPGIFERTLKYYREIGIDSATVSIVTPMPGTPFFDRLEREGRLLTGNWDRYNGKVDAVFRPKQMSPGDLEQGVAWFADQFYSLPSIYERLLLRSRVGLWWNLPRNIGYRLALQWRGRASFGPDEATPSRPVDLAGSPAALEVDRSAGSGGGEDSGEMSLVRHG